MAKIRILSTKKLEPALIEQAQEKGFRLQEQEFITIRYYSNEELKKKIASLSRSSIQAVFTSSHAVKAIEQYLTVSVPDWELFSLSGKTRTTILNAEYLPHTITEEADHAAALAEKIIGRQVRKVVFFCGSKRREVLPALLKEAGIEMEEVILYESEEASVKIDEAFDGVLFFSPSVVESFFAKNQLNDHTICFAIGATTTEALQTYTGNPIITCAQPAPEKMMAAVYEYFK